MKRTFGTIPYESFRFEMMVSRAKGDRIRKVRKFYVKYKFLSFGVLQYKMRGSKCVG